MPDAGRDVTGDVGVEGRVLDLVAEVVGVPRTVGALLVRQPLVGGTRLVVASAEVERHRRLDEVPRIGVTARDPRDVPVAELDGGDGIDGLDEFGAGDDAVDGGKEVQRRRHHATFCVYTTRLLPSTGLSARSSAATHFG